jgi:predicted ArsR family transcriptional regulator
MQARDYPDSPGFKSAGTSQEAAQAIAGHAKTLRARVLDAITSEPSGLSADAVADRLGESVLSVRPRVSELHRAGDIRRTEARARNASGMNATVWVASPSLQGPGATE